MSEVTIDPVIIIEVNGHRVRSEADWRERENRIVYTSTLVDDAGEPLPQLEGAAPMQALNQQILHNNPEYPIEQLLYDAEISRHRFAQELAGHTHIQRLRSLIGPHKKDRTVAPPVVTAPRVERPKKKV
jgi:hypothetical protein